MAIKISIIQEADIDGAVECIQRAFENDPYSNWVFDKSNVSKSGLGGKFAGVERCRWGIRHALFHVAKDPDSTTPDKVVRLIEGLIWLTDQLGIAMWLTPRQAGVPESWAEYVDNWRLWFGQLALNIRHGGRGGLVLKRYNIWKEKQEEAHKEVWTDPKGYYFCNIITVSPEAQGKGIGKLLFNTVFEKADAEGYACYLESSPQKGNVGKYLHFGFETAKEFECNDDGAVCKLTCMIRPPLSKK